MKKRKEILYPNAKDSVLNKDPVCCMQVDTRKFTLVSNGKRYYFCSEGCLEKFRNSPSEYVLDKDYDLIIIGGGPAGLTAGVYASIHKMKAFLISDDLGGQAIDSTKIENYMGFDFITGPELIKKFQDQLIGSHYLDHLIGDVELIENYNGGFKITTSDLKKYRSKTIIVSSGMKKRKLNITGEEKFQRKGIFYGNIQDLSFVQDCDAVVVGGGNTAMQIVENLNMVARKIYLVSDIKLTADAVLIERIRQIKNLVLFENCKVVQISGSKVLSSITIRKKGEKKHTTLPVCGVFAAIGSSPNSTLVNELVALNDHGEIIINNDCSTSFPGIFAAGDVTNTFGKRIIIAAGEGAKAAIAAKQYIVNLKKKEIKDNVTVK
ncbi:MAG: FAD-dependent oxidoreductase [Bacteroidales bacterium]|nr:FAD-dependent oxidoreductase [Bacteroidales bacterium]